MNKRLRILISNDDGYDSTGISELAKALSTCADIFICAPLENQSGSSSSMSLFDAVTVSYNESLCVVHGTPADCVQLALHGPNLLPWKPDLTVTGINMGGNLGDDTIYSGTVAAAAESVACGIPSIAFSLACIPEDQFPPSQYRAAAEIARDLVIRLHSKLLTNPSLMLNINIPDIASDKIMPPIVCPLGKRHPGRRISESNSKPNQLLRKFRFEANFDIIGGAGVNDFQVIESNHVAITPLQFDLTDNNNMELVKQWIE